MRPTSRSSPRSAMVRSGATICARPISPAARERHPVVIPGRRSIVFAKEFLEDRWTRGSSPRVTAEAAELALGLGAGRGLHGLHLRALLIERDEIDRIEQ